MNSHFRNFLFACGLVLLAVGSLQAATIVSARSGQWSVDTVWVGGVVPGPADDVVIADTCVVTLNQDATILSLTVGQGLSGTFQTSKTILTNLTINGNLTVNAGAGLKVQTADTVGGFSFAGPHTLTITGNITHNGILFDLRSGSTSTNPRTLGVINTTFAGATNSVVTINGAYSSTNGDFNGVTINKTGNARVILGSDMYINGGSTSGLPSMNSVTTFVNGIVETGNFTFVCQTSTSTSVTGASPTSYVLGAMGRGMSNTVGSTKDFPLGDADGYRPFNLRSTTAGTATGHHAVVRLVSGNANTGSSVLNGNIDRVSAVRYYKIAYNSGGGAATMSFDRYYPTYGFDDGVAMGNHDLRVAYSTDNRATWTRMDLISHPHTTNLTTPPTQIKPDSLNPPIVFTSGVTNVYIALADTTGGLNLLQRSTYITASAGTNGHISPNGIATVVLGGSLRFVMTADSAFQVDSVLVDDVLVDSTAGYTFTNVTVPHTIRVTFKVQQLAISAVAGPNGTITPSGTVLVPYGSDQTFTISPTGSYQVDSVIVDGVRVDSTTSYTFVSVMANHIIRAVFKSTSSTTTINVSLAAGWNIISNPVTNPIPGDSVRQLYPTSMNAYAFEFSGGYVQRYRLANGKGYWEKFPAAIVNPITGSARASDTLNVVAGWNMVGSITCPVDTGTIVSIPAGLRSSNWFGYSSGYTPVTQIIPGRAYWVKANGAGKFVLLCAADAPKVSPCQSLTSMLNTITITDSKGQSQTLYFGVDRTDAIPVGMYDMPPAPPAGAFDARFESVEGGSMVRTHASESVTGDFPIAVQSDAYPLTLGWKIGHGTSQYQLVLPGNQSRSLQGEGSISISNSSVAKLVLRLVGDGAIPSTFSLGRNYPNPFNPSTQIQYGLPVDSKVTVLIYNALGQRVRVLVQSTEVAGNHATEWDGKGDNGQQLSSGMYFVQLTAQGVNGSVFTGSQKMVMVK
jgi:hypothetical protein